MKPWYISTSETLVFLAILIRIGIILFTLPFFRAKEIPTTFKAFLCVAISTVFAFSLIHRLEPIQPTLTNLVWMVIGEFFIGTAFSLSVLVILGALEVAGDIVSFQMGFGFARVADPVTGVQITLISRFFQILGTLIFFALDGHHLMIRAVYLSFLKIPPGFILDLVGDLQPGQVLNFTGLIFTLAFKLAAPVIIVLFLSEVGMGLIVKFAPQINILVVSFALTIIIGILFAALSIEAWATLIEQAIKGLFTFLFKMLLR